MAVLPTKIFTQPDDEWFKSVNGGTLPHHSVVANPTSIPTYDNSSVMPKHYAIKGEMVTVQNVISDLKYFELESVLGVNLPNFIKEELISLLIKEMMNQNCISFTAQQDPTTLNRCFRARIFATPDSQIRIVKELLDKNNRA